ncbi:MAG: FumA C-terminus/TtdB family hydratase beta subunit [Treponemataceae bacterium]
MIIKYPEEKYKLKELRAGDIVEFEGVIFTARDAAHMRIKKNLENGILPPIDFADSFIFYAGPTPAKPGEIIGSIGPTTSSRMDGFCSIMKELKVTGTIGKGARSKQCSEFYKKNKILYFITTGGCGALLSKSVIKNEEIAFEDLGTESIKRLEVKNFKMICAIDYLGNDIFETGCSSVIDDDNGKIFDIKQESLKLHEINRGKLEMHSKVSVKNTKELSLAYTPGVAQPCLEIVKDPENSYKYTNRANTVAVITDGSAVLGLGNIGALAGMPVMEGKAILFKEFAGIDSIPICLDTQDTEQIIKTVKYLSLSFGGINLEDICSPHCVTIERRLIEELDIPVFHDDQHGTAIVVGAALLNYLRLTKKNIQDLTIVLSGTGAAGSSIACTLKKLGVGNLYAFNKDGVVESSKYDSYDFLIKELLKKKIIDDKKENNGTLASLLENADVFIGVSAQNILTPQMIRTMNQNSCVFALANPNPEISYEKAKEGGAYVVGTGRSDYPNQINNVLAFPGIFRGALDCRASKINEEMKLAASYAIANLIDDENLNPDYIIPSAFDKRVVQAVSQAVMQAALKSGVCKDKDLIKT